MGHTKKTFKYNFNANEFIKIWFSKNQDVFLPMINQIRFINFILDHPGSSFHFIYKDSLLSNKAKNELLDFCEKFNVIAINFDDIKTISKIDKQLKDQANIEIENTINNKGGDLGAASDLARLMPNIISLGFYLDFDTKAKFDQKLYNAKTPILAEVRTTEFEDGRISASTNNQFIAVAKEKDGTIHKNAIKALNEISISILNKYNNIKKIHIHNKEKTIINSILDIFTPVLNLYRGYEQVKIREINKAELDILSDIFSINLSYTAESFKLQEANTDNMLIKYILGKYFESSYSNNPSICSIRHFIKNSDNLITKAKEFMASELASFGHDYKAVYKYLNESYDLTDHVIYSSFVVKISGPLAFTKYMISKGQHNFILDKHLSKAISAQDNKIEIEPGVTIDRDGDTSWFKGQEHNKLSLTEGRTKIFELEELKALNTRMNEAIDSDPLHHILQEYFILGCKEIEGGFTGLCQNFETLNITEIEISGDNHIYL